MPGGMGRALGHPGASLTLSRGLVSTLVRMPAVLPVSFFSALTCPREQAWTPHAAAAQNTAASHPSPPAWEQQPLCHGESEPGRVLPSPGAPTGPEELPPSSLTHHKYENSEFRPV